MAQYLLQVAYASEGWVSLLKSPHYRLDAVRPAVEKLGEDRNRMVLFW